MKPLSIGLTLSLVIAMCVDAHASDPAGIWVKPEHVVFEPDEASATRVQIHGLLALHDANGTIVDGFGTHYSSPSRGYVYYACAPADLATCRMEWADLNAAIGHCAGFGGLSLPTGTLRCDSEAANRPDAYPIQMGVHSGLWQSMGTVCGYLDSVTAKDAGAGVCVLHPGTVNDAGAVDAAKDSMAGDTGTTGSGSGGHGGGSGVGGATARAGATGSGGGAALGGATGSDAAQTGSAGAAAASGAGNAVASGPGGRQGAGGASAAGGSGDAQSPNPPSRNPASEGCAIRTGAPARGAQALALIGCVLFGIRRRRASRRGPLS